jgi:hypothetical protein
LAQLAAPKETGALDRLPRSGARFTESEMMLAAVDNGETTTIDARRIGPPLVFERRRRDSFGQSVIEDLPAGPKFEFPVERAVFPDRALSDHEPGFDHAAEKWWAVNDLHRRYRAISWLGEALSDQRGRGLMPRANKALIEEQLCAKRRNLFNDVGLAISIRPAAISRGRRNDAQSQRSFQGFSP